MSTLIDENSINIQTISQILDEALIDASLDDDSEIYVTDGEFPYWINFDAERKFIRFFTFIKVDTPDRNAMLIFTNQCSKDLIFLNLYFMEDMERLACDYFMSCRGGVIREQFLHNTRKFGSIFRSALTRGEDAGLLGARR
jgi:hypothetical protein